MHGGKALDGAPHAAVSLEAFDSFSGLNRNNTFEWHIKDYTVRLKKGRTRAVLNHVGACWCGCGCGCLRVYCSRQSVCRLPPGPRGGCSLSLCLALLARPRREMHACMQFTHSLAH